ncbi:BRCT domain-containing protein [Spinellus fusiger]|nr:BRCT domain-containing protein [Spinellus fusiger]
MESPHTSYLFRGIVYKLETLLDKTTNKKLKAQLVQHGAVEVGTYEPTHIITNNPLCNSSNSETVSVTPLWVEASIKDEFLQEEKFFSVDSSKIVSGKVICISQISGYERMEIIDGILGLGGQYRDRWTLDTTHLLCDEPKGSDYEAAMEKGIKVVLRRWITDCIRLKRYIQEAYYQFPDPPLLKEQLAALSKEGGEQVENNIHSGILAYRKTLPSSVSFSWPFLEGYTIHLDSELALSSNEREDLIQHLVDAGANYSDKYTKSVDIIILQWRNTILYRRAVNDNVVVGSLWWMMNTLERQRLDHPSNVLLYYPIPKNGIPAFEGTIITISGYYGVARNYLQRLLTILGAEFTPHMEKSKTTHLVTATNDSKKYIHGKEWDIHVVNHLWVEECFREWKLKSVANEQFLYFPGERILNSLVGQTSLCKDTIELWRRLPTPEGSMPNQTSRKSKQPKLLHKDSLDNISLQGYSHKSGSQSTSVNSNSNKTATTPMEVDYESAVNGDLNEPASQLSTSEKKPRQKQKKDKQKIISDPSSQTLPSTRSFDTYDINNAPNSQGQGSKTKRPKYKNGFRIAITGGPIDNEDAAKLRAMGSSTTENILQATHLIVAKEMVKTTKLLCAINLGLFVVSLSWLTDSLKVESWKPETDYPVIDSEAESKFKFNLYKSIELARQRKASNERPWLYGYTFYIPGSRKETLKPVVETAGGKLASRKPLPQDNILVLSENQDPTLITQGLDIYLPDVVTTGALRQQLDLSEFSWQ